MMRPVGTLLVLLLLAKLIGLPGSHLAPLVAEDAYLAHAQDSGRSIQFGEKLSGEISVAGEKDSYTFHADAGDTVLFRLSTHWPYGNIELYSPEGYPLENIEMKVPTFTKKLPTAGTYRLTVSDRGDFFPAVIAYSCNASITQAMQWPSPLARLHRARPARTPTWALHVRRPRG
jgi:hypothetical protein